MDKYLQYDHLELSEDPSFIRWAKGSTSRDDLDWDGWLVNHPEKTELTTKAKSLVLAMKFVEDHPKEGTEKKIWNNIASEINNEDASQKPIQKKSILVRLMPYAAVAAVALIFFIFNLGNNYDTSVNVPFAKTESITLPDGSTVVVNADSRLAYNKDSWDDKRDVFLEGEAFFSVVKGSKFRVKTNNGYVHVLGTSFNVFARGNKLNVECETGKVMVQSSSVESILMPDQSVKVVDGSHKVDSTVEMGRRSTWRNGIFVYKVARITDVAAELERQFDVKISMHESLHDEFLTGSFKSLNMETALTEVFYPLGLKFNIDGKNVTITK